MLDTLIPQEDADAAKELAKAFGKRGIKLQLGKQCTKVEQKGNSLTVHFGDGESVDCDLMLVSVGRAPLVEGVGLEAAGVEFDKRKGITTDAHRRTTAVTSMRSATAPATGSWRTRRSAKVKWPPRTPAVTKRSSTTARCRARSTPIRKSPASG